MQFHDGRILYSASDLNKFLACAFLTTLELDSLGEGLPRPARQDDETELLARLGDQHEERYLKRLRAEGRDVVEIARNAPLDEAVRETLAAMKAGREIIYQAAFLDGNWMGRADFLRKVANGQDSAGNQWAWQYEVEDAKLARHTEPYFLLQLCYYSEHTARIQGTDPENMYVVLGDETIHAFRYADFSAYYRAVKREFLSRLQGGGATYPLPVEYCELCPWRPICDQRWSADDHLKLVANITTLQTARLNAAGITTLAQLGSSQLEQCPPKMERSTFEKLHRQASLQLAQRRADAAGAALPVSPEFLPHLPDEWLKKGFALLPAPCDQDVFFDMEGDPYYDVTASLEYLFGVYTRDDDTYRAFWGCDRSSNPLSDRLAEKHAFEQLIDFIMDRYHRFPGMHVYHYASYEKTKLKELSQRHATREGDVDTILRNDLLVDLYRVVRQSIAVGQPGYSIKQLEVYYGKRASDASIKSGGESILRFEEWLQGRHDPQARNDRILDELAEYNRWDCVSTHGLRDWLLSLRAELLQERNLNIPFFVGAVEEAATPQRDLYQDLKDRLEAVLPSDFDPAVNDPRYAAARPLWMARQMLEYHWREDKPAYWLFHDRCERYQEDPDDLLDDGETLVHLEFVDQQPVGGRSRSVLERYRFPIQEFKVEGGDCYSPRLKEPVGEIHSLEEDGDGGMLVLHRGPTRLKHGVLDAVVVRTVIPPGAIRAALANFSESLLSGDGPIRFAAAYDILTRGIPRRTSGSFRALQPEDPNEITIQPLIDDLDNSYLFIQGPPGSGKTYTGARLIINLLKVGRRIGVSANSHKAIHNLLDEVEDVARSRGIRFAGVKQITDNPESEYHSSRGFIQNGRSFDDAPEGTQLFAGTAWAICKAFGDDPLDFLFIDEAGQVALPNAIAMSTKTKNIVLLGDPLQLAHVSHTSHPGGVGKSVLEYLLGDELRPVDPSRGVLLAVSYRMNDPICRFISDTMYESRLRPAPGRERQRVDSPGIGGQGLRFIAVEHENNRQNSAEEAARIADEVALLLQGTVTDYDGQTGHLSKSDIIVVTPYNAQVRCIRRALQHRGGDAANVEVGTVDKFQGREAHIVFFSTAASTAEEAPRGVGFIFDRNRFNVAISRARSVAVLIASPKLMTARCNTVEQARLINGVQAFKERCERIP